MYIIDYNQNILNLFNDISCYPWGAVWPVGAAPVCTTRNLSLDLYSRLSLWTGATEGARWVAASFIETFSALFSGNDVSSLLDILMTVGAGRDVITDCGWWDVDGCRTIRSARLDTTITQTHSPTYITDYVWVIFWIDKGRHRVNRMITELHNQNCTNILKRNNNRLKSNQEIILQNLKTIRLSNNKTIKPAGY